MFLPQFVMLYSQGCEFSFCLIACCADVVDFLLLLRDGVVLLLDLLFEFLDNWSCLPRALKLLEFADFICEFNVLLLHILVLS